MQSTFAAQQRLHGGHSHTHSVPIIINYYNQPSRYEREDYRRFSTPSAFPYVSMPTHVESISRRRSSHYDPHLISLKPSGPILDTPQRTRTCANCGTQDTPSWRRCSPEQIVVCNACGLYYSEHKRHRPYRLKADGRTKAVRIIKTKGVAGDAPITEGLQSE